MSKCFWLLKTEPNTYSFEDLKKSPGRTTCWDGVRNYQARNFLRDRIQKGDEAFFYHSSTEPAGIVGTVTVVKAGYPDPTQFDEKSKYFDSDSTPEKPRWFCVDVQMSEEFNGLVTLEKLRNTKGLESMMVLRRGSRLSVQPVTKEEWDQIMSIAVRR